jgi:ribosomal protein S18 acetylase RimI-like enzyme
MAHSFPMDADPTAEPKADPILRPYAELEDYGSLYLSGIALFPEHRERGSGTRLFASVDERARALGRPRVSLICFERNEGAMRWYRRLGFEELARRPLVPHPLLHYADGDAVLLARGVGDDASGREIS